MNPASITFRSIGVIRSEHTEPAHMSIQPAFARGCRGQADSPGVQPLLP